MYLTKREREMEEASKKGYASGYGAPYYTPSCPYSKELEPHLYQAWQDAFKRAQDERYERY